MPHRPAAGRRCASACPSRARRARCPDWWPNDQWPLVYLTFGSVAPTMDFFPGLYRAAIDALSALPVRVLVTVGRERDPADIGPVAPNVHVAGWVPQADVMPHAAAMVCHGGSGTVNAAPGGRHPDGRRAAVRRPAAQRSSRRRDRRRHRARAGSARAAARRRPQPARRRLLPRRGGPDRRRTRSGCRPSTPRPRCCARWRLRASRARWREARPGRGRPRPACRRCCAGACAPCWWRATARARSACRPCPARGA